MPQRFNFTGRKRILETQAKIHVIKEAKPLKICLEQTFANNYSSDDIVIIEAIRRTKKERVPLGSVSQIAPQNAISFKSFQDGNEVFFRISVVDPLTNKLKGLAKRLRDADKNQNPSNVRSILPVALSQEEDEMGDCFWTLKYSEANPLLLLSSKKFSSFEPLKSAEFKALVWPEILRQILVYIYIIRWDDFPEWEEDWKKYVEENIGMPGAPVPQSTFNDEYIGKVIDWIDQAVKMFAQHENLSSIVIPNFNTNGENDE